jgi:hypothetical protein
LLHVHLHCSGYFPCVHPFYYISWFSYYFSFSLPLSFASSPVFPLDLNLSLSSCFSFCWTKYPF